MVEVAPGRLCSCCWLRQVWGLSLVLTHFMCVRTSESPHTHEVLTHKHDGHLVAMLVLAKAELSPACCTPAWASSHPQADG